MHVIVITHLQEGGREEGNGKVEIMSESRGREGREHFVCLKTNDLSNSLFLEPKPSERDAKMKSSITRYKLPSIIYHLSITIDPPAVYLPLNHTPAVFPVWCPGISSACWNRGSSSGLRRSRGREPRQSPGGPSWADSPSPWLPGRDTREMSIETEVARTQQKHSHFKEQRVSVSSLSF